MSRRLALCTATATLLGVVLTGCGGSDASGTGPSAPPATPAAAAPRPQASTAGPAAQDTAAQDPAAQIERAVTDAQKELDGIDQDLASDSP